ncbi:hypothetical protein PUN28_004316 [Cardiocondyla obscurior]|uniref:Uncharacterized protein n=1 Tax=Cardiocondyla obscurior TaxID=286306 RepID=A0AAW2GE07_9HYME
MKPILAKLTLHKRHLQIRRLYFFWFSSLAHRRRFAEIELPLAYNAKQCRNKIRHFTSYVVYLTPVVQHSHIFQHLAQQSLRLLTIRSRGTFYSQLRLGSCMLRTAFRHLVEARKPHAPLPSPPESRSSYSQIQYKSASSCSLLFCYSFLLTLDARTNSGQWCRIEHLFYRSTRISRESARRNGTRRIWRDSARSRY